MKRNNVYKVIAILVILIAMVAGGILLKREKQEVKEATVITEAPTLEKVVALNFIGLSTPNTNMAIVNLIKQYEHIGTFFVPGLLAAENTELLQTLSKEGYGIGSNGYIGTSKMELKTQDEMIDSFIRTNEIIGKWTKKRASILLYCNGTQYTNELLKAAYTSGNKKVVESNHIINYRSFSSYEQTLDYIRKLPKGAILTIKMDGELEQVEYDKKEQNERPAEDKKPGITDTPAVQMEEEERLVMVVEWVLKALTEEDYRTVLCEELQNIQDKDSDEVNSIEEAARQRVEELRQVNQGKKAVIHQKIYTVQPAVGYSFSGISQTETLKEVLVQLGKEQIKATFFVSQQDIEMVPEEINQIVQAGHELQIMLTEEAGKDYFGVARTILEVKDYIQEHFGQNAELVRYPYDITYTDEMLEAISATGCKVIGQNLSVSLSKIGKEATAEEVMNTIFHAGNTALSRGYNVYFRMDYYKDPRVVTELIQRIKKEKVDPIGYIDDGKKHYGYTFATLSELVNNYGVYQYPVAEGDVLVEILGRNAPNYLKNIENSTELIIERYIGNPYAQSKESLPGFTEDEISQIDKTGRFTSDKVIFLTFDDWGSDVAINKLLYVLEKYNVKASFFIRTNYIHDNPNLLRAIALAGHDIASHSHSHLLLANPTEQRGVYAELGTEEIKILQQDLITSYDELQNVVGDILIDGRPALQSYFRAPTLAVSKKGLETVLDSGFSYIIAGDFSTHDYEAKSAQELIDKFKINVQEGSIVVMHMSDEAKFTAEALDVLIPYYLEQGYQFARLGDYLKNE